MGLGPEERGVRGSGLESKWEHKAERAGADDKGQEGDEATAAGGRVSLMGGPGEGIWARARAPET